MRRRKKAADKNAEKGTEKNIDYAEAIKGREQGFEDDINDPFENYFQGMFAITLTLLGQFVLYEKHTAIGMTAITATRALSEVLPETQLRRPGATGATTDMPMTKMNTGYSMPVNDIMCPSSIKLSMQ